ncbi:helix-turn-helix domain-containing protein [Fructobacillus tropaeoli]|uniref:helix-turn-helix domain-containing protein n=1 Tax=Fructobacillus tropaeoli TaxID=709323 RepID=UPI002DA68C21|nr:DNA replication protein DnaD (DnaD) [Fructobacillus tropaeoli]
MAELTHFTQIPIWVDEIDNITDFQARLLGFVSTLENTSGSAFPSNKRLAEKYHKSIKTVQNALSDLYDKGFLESNKIYKENSKEIEKRYLRIIKPEKSTGVPTPEIGHRVPQKSGVPYPQNRDNPTPEIGQDNISINKSINRSLNNMVEDENDEPLIDPFLAKKMLTAYNKATERNNKNAGTFSSLAMKNVSLEDFQDVLNYMVATFSSVEYITVKSLIVRFEEHLTSANERGFVDGKIPKPKKLKGKQEPKIATNADIQQQQKQQQQNQPQEDLMAILNGRKTHV